MPANLARYAGSLPPPLGGARASGTRAARIWVHIPAARQGPGTQEWLAKPGARPPPISAAPIPSGNGLILQRATTLPLAQTAQESVHDSARQPESFGHHHMDVRGQAPPFAALSLSRSCRIASA
jgi:hypothetical protein